MKSCLFSENIAPFGAVFYIYKSGDMVIERNTFSNNKAITSGGVMYILDSKSDTALVELKSNVYTSNEA